MAGDISTQLGYDRNNQGVDTRIYEGLPIERASLSDNLHDNGLRTAILRQERREHYHGLTPDELFDDCAEDYM